MMTLSYLYSTFILLLFHLYLSTAQLTGTLTHCNHDPNLITAVITNTDTHHVSILKHNTIFDTSHLSLPFSVINAAGTPLPIGKSHLFYTGVGRDDFLDLAPGENFTRQFNLTEYVTLKQKGSEHVQTIKILLSSAFQGLKDHDGVYVVHPAAKGRLIDGQLRLGDVSKVNMTSISHTSMSLQITLPVTVWDSHPMTRRADTTGGLQLLMDDCSPKHAAKASMGMLHASYLAGAALNAATNFSQVPFNYFFPSNPNTANIVSGVMNRVIQAQLGQGEAIYVTCHDPLKGCRRTIFFERTLGYATYKDGFPLIVLCPTGLALPPNPTPCSGHPGALTIGSLLLHEMMHIHSISGPGLVINDWTGYAAQEVGNAVKAGKDTTMEASAYNLVGSWAWDLGLGGKPWNEQKVCLERFSTGWFRSTSFFG